MRHEHSLYDLNFFLAVRCRHSVRGLAFLSEPSYYR
jgi:hypothetical protein